MFEKCACGAPFNVAHAMTVDGEAFELKRTSKMMPGGASGSYAEHEGRKNREYKERILKVERADFTPLVFSLTGGMGPQAQAVVRRVAYWLSVRRCRSQISWVGSVLDCRSQSCALLSHACVGVGA